MLCVRILRGTKVIDAEPGWAGTLRRESDRLVIDVGSGDGRFVYESARADPRSVYLGFDPDATALSEYAYRAARKPARGGVANARFVVASVEQPPPELAGLADVVRVNFPWGSLLRGLLEPQADVLRSIAGLVRPGGAFEVVLAYDPGHDTGAFAGDRLPDLDETYVDEVLAPAYAAAGLSVSGRRRLTQDEALAIPSTWGRRLLHARPRPVFLIGGTIG